jgi:hypothetical protein
VSVGYSKETTVDWSEAVTCPRCRVRFGGLGWLGFKIACTLGFLALCVQMPIGFMLDASETPVGWSRAAGLFIWIAALWIGNRAFRVKLQTADARVRFEPVTARVPPA